jgi:CubicO group peptidase (beta-lactamase class C family)/D-alanyl-D-alanine dipeptidase
MRFGRSLLACTLLLPSLLHSENFPASVKALNAWLPQRLAAQQNPGFVIALTRRDTTIYRQAFGNWKTENSIRAASLTKMFTAIAVMQLVDDGRLDLDSPVSRYLPELRPGNPFPGEPTIRHLLAHHSGLVREPLLGNYFDPRPATLVATVASLSRSTIIHEPGQRMKYSNAGYAVLGRVLEKVGGEEWDARLQSRVLNPLGMKSAGLKLNDAVRRNLPPGEMWAMDGRRFPAPAFDFGMGPAIGLHANIDDLARFTRWLLQPHAAPLLRNETRTQMFQRQFGSMYGLGFQISALDGHAVYGHDGVNYGVATVLLANPGTGFGCVAASAQDSSNDFVRSICQQALRWLQQEQKLQPLTPAMLSEPLSKEEIDRYTGRFLTEKGRRVNTIALNGRLWKRADNEAQWCELRRVDKAIIGDGLLCQQPEQFPHRWTREKAPPFKELPPAFSVLLGDYGPDHTMITLFEERGLLHAQVEWHDAYPLQAGKDPDTFLFPDYGLYSGESLRIERLTNGTVKNIHLSGIAFPRRNYPRHAEIFKGINGNIARLRKLAEATPMPDFPDPGQTTPQLVNLRRVDPTMRFDIRYAGVRNFLGLPVYASPDAWLEKSAAEALRRVNFRLRRQFLQLMVLDAYRPWHVTKIFRDATPPHLHDYVADPAKGSRHNRGCAVDVTLFDLRRMMEVPMVSGFDEMNHRAWPLNPGGTEYQRHYRDLLRRSMEAEGFTVNPMEWWHFDCKDWEQFRPDNRSFAELSSPPKAKPQR